MTTDVFLLNTDNTDNTDRVLCVTTDVFLLNTDNTDFTDNLVLPHNGTKDPFLTPPNKNIRVIREIRVQKLYASRINKEYPCPQK